MPKYQLKPIEYEAFQWNGPQATDKPEWFTAATKKKGEEVGSLRENDHILMGDREHCVVLTKYGVDRADVGDWLVFCHTGEILVFATKDFNDTFTLVTDAG
jgi:hypothetical protein